LEGEAAPSAPKPIRLSLSGGGVGFVTERRFNVGDRLVLTIMLPSHPTITATAEIVRATPVEKNETMFSVGARFTAVDDKDHDRILRYLINVQRERRRDRYAT
jgi:c-di-GMP-binding flagellar brake protein YcgR